MIFSDVNYSNVYVGTIYHNDIKNKATLEAKEFNMNEPLSREESRKRIVKLLEKTPAELAYLQGTEGEPTFFTYNKTLLEQDGDSLEQLQKHTQKLQNLKNNEPLPSENEFLSVIDKLTQEIEDILVNFYQNNSNSDEFKELLNSAVQVTYIIKNREEKEQKLLNFLKQSQNNTNYFESQDFLDKLMGKSDFIKGGEVTLGEIYEQGKGDEALLRNYTLVNIHLANSLEYFFRLAETFGASSSSKDSIQSNMQIAQRYLYNQSGSIDDSFKIGDFVVSFNEDPMLVNPFLDGSGFSINYHKSNDILAAIISSFDATQTFLNVLENKERLETDSTDSIMQTLLKESKENKKV